MKNRSAGDMIQAYQALINQLNDILNKECSEQFKKLITINNEMYLLAPPHDHRCNQVEKEIQTFKDHFIQQFSPSPPFK